MEADVSKQTTSLQKLKKASQKQHNMDNKGYSSFHDQVEILNDHYLY